MMSVTTSFLREEVAAANQSKKKESPAWKHHESGHRPNFDKRLDFKSQHKSSKRQDHFTPLTKTPKKILAMDTVKFKAPPPMTGPAENQNKNKLCEFHRDKGHSTDECIYLRSGQETPIVIEAEVEGHLILHMYIDGGSALEVLYEQCFNRLHPKIKNQIILATTPLLGFNGEISWPLGQISLIVTLGDEEHSASALMNVMVVRSSSPYNGIIGRPGLWKIQAVPSTAHGMLKFLVEEGTTMIRSTTIIPAECRMVIEAQSTFAPREPATAEGIKIAIHPEYPEQTITISGSLSEKGRMELFNLLKENLDIFAWKWADMTDVPRSIAEHRLNISEGCQPIRQERRGQAPDRNKAIQEEVAKLVEAEIMMEVHYHDWLSNPVIVKKNYGSWRMCVDFTYLNKSCPKDCYPLPEIDWKVESLCGCPFKCFLDAYKGYHQIRVAEEDEEKMAFHTNQGVFYYTKMSFGLKNAGATYQRLVDKAFEKQIGRNLEVYVDDLVIKIRTECEILRDIKETFHNLRNINMKLNSKKCTFGAEEGAFLGHVVSMQGIKACPEKVEAVDNAQIIHISMALFMYI
ncbi:reverse transcriptase domain-containing protein [Tanacetum coccineum]